MTTFETDFQRFKGLANEFLQQLPNVTTIEQVQAGSKCLLIGYMNMTGAELERHQAGLLVEICERRATQREREILLDPLRTDCSGH